MENSELLCPQELPGNESGICLTYLVLQVYAFNLNILQKKVFYKLLITNHSDIHLYLHAYIFYLYVHIYIFHYVQITEINCFERLHKNNLDFILNN